VAGQEVGLWVRMSVHGESAEMSYLSAIWLLKLTICENIFRSWRWPQMWQAWLCINGVSAAVFCRNEMARRPGGLKRRHGLHRQRSWLKYRLLSVASQTKASDSWRLAC